MYAASIMLLLTSLQTCCCHVGCGAVFQMPQGCLSQHPCRYLRMAIMQLMLVKPAVALLCAALAPTAHAKRIKQLRLVAVLAMGVAMHSIFTVYINMKPFMRGLDASGKFLGIKVVVAIILLQQAAASVLLSMDLVPEGRFGYTTEENAQRITCTATIIEMALFSLLLSYLFSHRSMTHVEHSRSVSRRASRNGELRNDASTHDVADVLQAAARADGAANVRESMQRFGGDGAAASGGGAGGTVSVRASGHLFEEVMGDSKAAGPRRQASEGVSLLSVRSMLLPWHAERT